MRKLLSPIGWVAIGSVVTFILGNEGLLWQWKSSQREDLKLRIELHEKIEDRVLKVAQLQAELGQLTISQRATPTQLSEATGASIAAKSDQLLVLKQDVDAFEAILAEIEKRPPRQFPERAFNPPPPPVLLSIQAVP